MYGGNKQDYIEKTNGIAGVGATKVTRAWDGPSTVKLTILDSNTTKPRIYCTDSAKYNGSSRAG